MTVESKRAAVVTGGGRGIGAAVSTRLAQDGFVVGVHYGSNKSQAHETVARILDAGGYAFAFQADLADEDGLGDKFWQAYDAAKDHAGFNGAVLHTLVNNAGVTLRGPIEEFSMVDFSTQHSVNVVAPYVVTKSALTRLCDNGRIINISSGVTRIAFPEIIAYSMTKGAINAFTFTLAKYLGHRGITVNAVAPGVIDTDINANWLRGNVDAMSAVAESTALGRVGQPSDIAGVVAFLASSDGGWVTGQIIDATGGTHL